MTNNKILSKDQYEVIADFRYQLRKFVRQSEELARSAGITPLQYLLLLQVHGQPGRDWATITELAERLQAKHHGVVSLVDRSERAGLVRREDCPDDGRQVRIHATAKGLRLLEKMVMRHREQLLNLEGRFAVPGRKALGE
jgi:DNA-binding MarR family transcriptional regulator